jgi:hypothetical protein
MNNICKYIESIDFDIKNKLKNSSDINVFDILINKDIGKDDDAYNKVLNEYKNFTTEIKELGNMRMNSKSFKNKKNEDLNNDKNTIYNNFKEKLNKICSNPYELTNYLIEIFYIEFSSSNKDILWNIYGKYIYQNVKNKNCETVYFPINDECGDIEYLDKRYSLQEVNLEQI